MRFDSYTESPRAVAEVSLDGCWLRVNPALCQLFGYTADELTHLRVPEITHPEDRAYSVTIVDQALHHHEQSQEELKRYIHKDGRVLWVLLQTTLKRNETGEPTHFLSFLEDVSERVQNEPLARAMARRLQTLQEQERQRIARELHNELGQVLSSLKIELAWLHGKVPKRSQARTERLGLLVDGILASVRRLWRDLRPSILDELGLEAAVDWLLQETCGLNGIPWHFTPADSLLRLDSTARVALFRICQEALALLLADSHPTLVRVSLTLSAEEIDMAVTADGVDSPPVSQSALLGIQDRAKLLGGQLTVLADPLLGTTLRVAVPRVRPSANRRRVPPQWE